MSIWLTALRVGGAGVWKVLPEHEGGTLINAKPRAYVLPENFGQRVKVEREAPVTPP
jgi:hypothetical protein